MNQQTQRKNTIGTYQRIAECIADDWVGMPRILDYGAGYCLGAQVLGLNVDSFEPNPREGVTPTFTRIVEVPVATYDIVVCNCVLNVLESWIERNLVVRNIVGALKPGGVAYIMVRSWGDVGSAINKVREGDGWRMSTGSFQRGYRYDELEMIVANLGQTERINKVSNIGIRLTIPE